MVAELERLRSATPRSGMLAFDGDGTLWRGDIGEALFEALLAERGVRPAALGALRAEARRCELGEPAAEPGASEPDATGVAAFLYAAYRRGAYADADAFAMMAWAFAGWALDELDARIARFLDDIDFEAAVRRPLGAVLRWAERSGVEVWLVSASPLAAVRAAGARLGIGPDRVLAMTPRVADRRLCAELALPATYGPGKLARLRSARPDAELLGAFGDSTYDFDLLAASRLPVMVSPSAALRARGHELPRAVVLDEAANQPLPPPA